MLLISYGYHMIILSKCEIKKRYQSMYRALIIHPCAKVVCSTHLHPHHQGARQWVAAGRRRKEGRPTSFYRGQTPPTLLFPSPLHPLLFSSPVSLSAPTVAALKLVSQGSLVCVRWLHRKRLLHILPCCDLRNEAAENHWTAATVSMVTAVHLHIHSSTHSFIHPFIHSCGSSKLAKILLLGCWKPLEPVN